MNTKAQSDSTFFLFIIIFLIIGGLYLMDNYHNNIMAEKLCNKINETYNDRYGMQKVECNPGHILKVIDNPTITTDKWGNKISNKGSYCIVDFDNRIMECI